jgi:hypothetical protein
MRNAASIQEGKSFEEKNMGYFHCSCVKDEHSAWVHPANNNQQTTTITTTITTTTTTATTTTASGISSAVAAESGGGGGRGMALESTAT